MESIYGEQEEYLGKFGELFLTIKGNIAFHCTLCEERFKGFKDYNDHILETHYAPDLKDLADSQDEDDTFDPLSDESHSINCKEYSIKIEKEEEPHDLPEILERLDESPGEKTEFQSLFEEDETGKPDKIIMNEIIPNEPIRPTIRSININPTIKDRKYKCPYCEFTCADKANIRKHIRRHSLNKPHECKECGKAFYTRTEVNVHVRSHTGERPFLCNLCGRSFITSGKLSDHQRRHTNTRDKECPVCKMTFINSNGLRGHMAIHSDKRNYKCTLCDASFKVSGGLRNHMKLHQNKREYQCKLCSAQFNQNAGLHSHMKTCHSHVSPLESLLL